MKKLKINKESVATLTDEQMQNIRGATFVHHTCYCNDTESCTFAYQCCPPPEEKIIVEKKFNL